MTTAADSPPPASFEAAMQELENLVDQMERGDLQLEEALKQYRRGQQLLQYCQQTLADAGQQLRAFEQAGEMTAHDQADTDALSGQ